MADVKIIGKTGQIYDVDSESVASLPEGFRTATPEEIAKFEVNQYAEKEPIKARTEALGRGFTRGATLGTSDFVGDKARTKALQEKFPVTSGAGELGSFFIPGIGQAKIATKAGQVAAKAVLKKTTAEIAAESLAKKIATETGKDVAQMATTSTARKIGTRVIEEGTEGALFGLTQGISETALGNPENVGETLLFSTGIGGVLGGTVGGALSSLGSVLTKTKSAAKSVTDRVSGSISQKVADEADSSLLKVFNYNKKTLSKDITDDNLFKREIPNSQVLTDFIRKNILGKKIVDGKLIDDSDLLKRSAKSELKLISKTKDLPELQNILMTGKREVGEQISNLYDNSFRIETKDLMNVFEENIDALSKGSALEVKIAKRLNKNYKTYKKNFLNEEQATAKAVAKIDKRLDELNNLSNTTKDKQQLNKIKQEIKSLKDSRENNAIKKSLTAKEAHKFRQMMDKDEGLFDKDDFLGKQEFLKLRSQINSKITEKMESSTNSKLKELNKQYSIYSQLDKNLRKGVSGGVNFNANDAALVLSSAYWGVAPALLAAGRVGFKTYGKEAISVLGRREGPTLASINYINEKQKQMINSGVVNAIKKSGSTISNVGKVGAVSLLTGEMIKDENRAYEENYKTVVSMNNNPSEVAQKMGERFMDIQDYAPRVALSAQDTLIRGLNFLQTKLPITPDQLLFDDEFQMPSHSEVQEFNTYVRLVNNPMQILQDFKDGDLTYEGVEVLKNVYPSVYNDIVSAVVSEVSNNKGKFSYQEKLQIATLLDTPVDGYTTDEFLMNMQARFLESNQQAEQSKGNNLKGSGKIGADREITNTQRIQNK